MSEVDEAPALAVKIIILTINHKVLESYGLVPVMLGFYGAQKLSESSQEPRTEAHHPAIRAEEIFRPDGSRQHKIIVEIEDMLAHLGDVPEYRLDCI